MSRTNDKKKFNQAVKMVDKINKMIKSGKWLYRKDHHGYHDFITTEFIIDLDEKIIYEKEENSRHMLWGKNWNQSLTFLKEYFESFSLIDHSLMEKVELD